MLEVTTAPERPGSGASAKAAQGGFTLIELLVVMSILAIMLGLGVPAFRDFIASQRVKAAATELMTTVLMARSEAVKRNVTTGVTITPKPSGWTGGWTATFGDPAKTLHDQEALPSISVTTYSDTACATAAPVASVVLGSNGRAGASSCFKFESNSAGTSRCVKVDLTGIPSSGSCP